MYWIQAALRFWGFRKDTGLLVSMEQLAVESTGAANSIMVAYISDTEGGGQGSCNPHGLGKARRNKRKSPSAKRQSAARSRKRSKLSTEEAER